MDYAIGSAVTLLVVWLAPKIWKWIMDDDGWPCLHDKRKEALK